MAQRRVGSTPKKAATGGSLEPKTSRSSQPELFDIGASTVVEPELKRIRHPVWTESKARLIRAYLRLFTFVTKHGTYIDAFAGPQRIENEDMWSARLVLESEPRWLRHFHLFEQDPDKVRRLQQLALEHNQMLAGRGEAARDIVVHPGDSNISIPEMLRLAPIRDREATFALLDQRTFECKWETVRALACHKRGGHKIEIFYFLPNAWLGRAFAGLTRHPETAEQWWGRTDWAMLGRMKGQDRAILFSDRIREEFNYASVKPWPIRERSAGGGGVMYYMIHATDHPEAPVLMRRAFERSVDPTKPVDQLVLDRLLGTDDPSRPVS